MQEQCSQHFMEQIIQLFHLLQINRIDIDQVLAGKSQADLLTSREVEMLQTACRTMDALPGGILICQADKDQPLLYANRSLFSLLRCETPADFSSLTHNSFRGIIHPEDLDAAVERIRTQDPRGQQPDCIEYRIRCRDGSVRWVEAYHRLLHCETAGEVFYAFLGDTTDKHQRQQKQLDEALDKANLSVVAKNTFLTNISHDMRTPLNAIFGFTTLAKTSLDDTDTLLAYLNQVENASKKLLDMISQVLEVTALSASDELTEVECDLCTVCQGVYDFLQPHAQEKEISYTLDFVGVKHRGVRADQEKLKQMMLNLVNNAITYTKPGGSVSISVTEGDELPGQESVYYIKVQDSGIGISEDFINHIFEPFSREKNSTSSGIHSIGLGLTIVKSIVDKMGGTIDAKSVVDRGSTFTVSLRLHTLPLPADGAAARITPPAKQTLLLVEDNEINREIETELLERRDFIIDSAENGLIALEKIKRAAPGTYDLILMDLKMPVMDGWETAAAIRSLPDPALAGIPIIALSASIFLDDYRKSDECGINAHLAKPMNLPVLVETIKKLTAKE